MSGTWLDFWVVILTQLIIFCVHAVYEKRTREIPHILLLAIATGIPFGIAFDIIVGKLIGFYSYHLGFGPLFLLVNGAFSYGFMQANVLLMERARLLHFYLWTVLVAALYEIINHFYPVWTWEFGPNDQFEYGAVVFICYFGIASLMALTWQLVFKHHFAWIERILKLPVN